MYLTSQIPKTIGTYSGLERDLILSILVYFEYDDLTKQVLFRLFPNKERIRLNLRSLAKVGMESRISFIIIMIIKVFKIIHYNV